MNKLIQLFLLLIISTTLSAQNIDTTQIDKFINNIRSELNLRTGLTVGIVIANEIVFSKGYGYSNIERKIKSTADSPFYIASSTKSFTAALVELLSENDTINIDKPMSHYLPQLTFNNKLLNPNLITIRAY